MKYNVVQKSVETSVKIFTNDLEDALKKIYKQPVDLINGKDKEAINKILGKYLEKNLRLKVNDSLQKFNILGFEREEEAVWVYLEYKNCPQPEKIEIENSILYEFLSGQTNIVHFEVNGVKKTSKVNAPEKSILFEF